MDDPLTVHLRNPFHVCSVAVWYSSCFLMLEERELFIDNLLIRYPLNHRHDFSRPALRHGILNSLFQVALYLPS